jgi:hypothetical protein
MTFTPGIQKSLLLAASFLILRCGSADKQTSILGSWRVDSICTYYNGFTFVRKDIIDEPLLEYQSEGKLKMSKGEESRMFLFNITAQDTLYHRTADQKTLEKYSILKLNTAQLILRKEMIPVFKGMNQQRYELRYLSKVKNRI